MGARAKRMLVIGLVAAAAIAAAGAVFVTRSGCHNLGAGKAHSHKPTEVFGTFGAFGVADGTTHSQLLARFGPPDAKRSNCWVYRIRGTTLRGTEVPPPIRGVDAVRYCFYYGVIAVIENHYRPGSHINPYAQSWIAPLSFGCGGKRCRPQ